MESSGSKRETCRVALRLRGFTLLEVLVVIVIILILASMLLPIYSSFNARADEARCLANLRSLYVAASGYLQAAGSWPQIPAKLFIDEPKTYARAWVSALAPYGATHSTWICPTLQRSFKLSMDALEEEENYRIDFVAAPFDENPAAPRQDPNHPWFIEKAGVHPRGNLLVLANGTTTSLLDLTGKTLGQ
jgi:prepilin-type N-terminal cleavage/methylation domain-containing protein